MTEAIKALILAVVQGITEFLPISSSAHLLALENMLDFHAEGLAFDVSLHMATLVAVIIYFRREIVLLARSENRWAILLRVCIATVPVGVLGFLLASIREDISPWVAVGGWVFSSAYLLLTRRLDGATPYVRLSSLEALGVGLAQSLSIFPGVSRSGATISMGLWLGLSRDSAAKFSFLIAIPAMLGAGAHEVLKILKSPAAPGTPWLQCGLAMPVAFLTGLLAIHLLLRAVRSSTFHRFGYYNLCAAILFGVYLIISG